MANFTVEAKYPPQETPITGENTRSLDLFRIDGKKALITGGNGGIGSGIARGLAEAGADIVIIQIPGNTSQFPQELAKDTGRQVSVYDSDLSNSDNIRKTVQKIFDDGHKIDILANVAGITGGFVPILEENDKHRELVYQIHVHAVYILSQLIGKHIAERGTGGKIINIASLAAHRAATRFSVYGSAKAAVAQLTDSLSTELAIYNIQVNVLYPGWIHTPLSQKTVENPEVSKPILEKIPAGRWGKPADFKGIAVFLASSASDYITGARIFVDGGTHSI